MAEQLPPPPGDETGQGPQPKGVKPPPRCKAILICQKTIIEAGSGNVSIIGTFDRFSVPAFPAVIPPFEVFLMLTEGIGRYDVVIEIHDLKLDAVIARAPALAIEFRERLVRRSVIIPVPPMLLQHAGTYDFVVVANGQEIDRQQFSAVAPEHPKGDSNAANESA